MSQVHQKYKLYHEECSRHSEKEWRWVPGFDDRYMVSSCGDVRLHRSFNGLGAYVVKVPRIVRLQKMKNGYISVYIQTQHQRVYYYVHRFVLFAFLGEPEHLINTSERLRPSGRREKEGAAARRQLFPGLFKVFLRLFNVDNPA